MYAFTRSSLIGANLQFAHLEKVNFQSARLAQVNFAGTDLTKAKLPLDYPYDVYCDQDNIFDHDFDPKLVGWKNKS